MRKRIVASAVIAAMIGMGAGVATHASEPVRGDTANSACDWSGVTVWEDGSVSVDRSESAQQSRSDMWVSGCRE